MSRSKVVSLTPETAQKTVENIDKLQSETELNSFLTNSNSLLKLTLTQNRLRSKAPLTRPPT